MTTDTLIAEPEISTETVREHGLNAEEYQRILNALGREPNITELGIFSVMWSEHCSYKSSRLHLKKLPTTGPQVICGPGENAGVIDIGDGQAAIFKMESHNHPSYIEPYQGAATGVGGILRDVFTMGARPVANLNALRFGRPDHPKMKHLVKGVVAGIGGYGNCVGVPTVGGETNFDPAYDGNIIVNAMTVGVADADKIFYSAASGVGNPVTAVLLNFRGYDTLLELFVLLLAVLGVWSLGGTALSNDAIAGPVLSSLTRLLTPVLLLVAAYLVWAGADSPGGAFQAGSVLGAAGVLLLLSGHGALPARMALPLRALLLAGPGMFLLMAAGMVLLEGKLLFYPPEHAGRLILLLETVATVSIGATLATLFLGGDPATDEEGP